MGEENGNERYLVNVSKLEKLMEEKRNEQNVKGYVRYLKIQI
jgi:hypothetical protein